MGFYVISYVQGNLVVGEFNLVVGEIGLDTEPLHPYGGCLES